MIKTAIFGLLLATSSAGLAQSTGQPAADPLSPATPMTTPSGTTPATPAVPATPADPATATPATPATPAEPATPAAPATETAAPADTATIVSTDWAKYDTNNNKQLSRAEFNKWVTTLQTAAGQAAPTRSYLNGAFRQADANKSGGISEQELVSFLNA